MVWVRRILERRAGEAAMNLQHRYLAAAASFGGRKAFAALRREIKRLIRDAGMPASPAPEVTAENLIERLGLKQVGT